MATGPPTATSGRRTDPRRDGRRIGNDGAGFPASQARPRQARPRQPGTTHFRSSPVRPARFWYVCHSQCKPVHLHWPLKDKVTNGFNRLLQRTLTHWKAIVENWYFMKKLTILSFSWLLFPWALRGREKVRRTALAEGNVRVRNRLRWEKVVARWLSSASLLRWT